MKRLLAAMLVLGCGTDPTVPPLLPPPAADVVEHATDPGPPDLGAPDVEEVAAPDLPPDVEEDTYVPPPPPPPPPPWLACDAGDEAWVKQALPLLLGRKPAGMREVRLLVDIVKQTDRETVARGLMRSPEFDARWEAWLEDELRINRVGDKMHAECYGLPKVAAASGDLAVWVRDHAPSDPGPGYAFNMTDVVRSALRLDDLTPIYRAHLFAMLQKPIQGANVAPLEMDLSRRQDFGQIFEATYLHRNVVCAGCHNSQYSTTDDPDPAKDRFWPMPGLFEQAIYGDSSGIDEMALFSLFRTLDVVADDGMQPWGIDPTCGRFRSPFLVPPDPAGIDAWFMAKVGTVATIWSVEAALHQGVEALRLDGLQMDPDTLAVDGPEAFAHLLSARLVNQVWQEAFGYPLTLVHYFPRNLAQEDLLLQLTTHFIASQWSLRTLLGEIVTHPLFNENAPVDGCGGESAYLLPQVFNPWSSAESEEELQQNSVGDTVHRFGARTLLRMVAKALAWAAAPAYPNLAEEDFQKAVGVFVKDAEPGFSGVDFQGLLAWESRYGACAVRNAGAEAGPGGADSCVGACGGKATGGCRCDDACEASEPSGECCADYEATCVTGVPADPSGVPADWIGGLVMAATAQDTTLRTLVAALKDRLIAEPDVSEVEAPLVAALFGAPSLDTPLAQIDGWAARARSYCGVLLQTPMLQLAGVPPPDQATLPDLVVGGASAAALCATWAPVLLDPAEWTITCEGTSVIVEKVEKVK